MAEIKSEGMDKHEFENWALSRKLKADFCIYGQSGLRCQEQNQRLSMQYSSKSLKLSMETLIKKIMSVFTEKYELEYPDKSDMIAL